MVIGIANLIPGVSGGTLAVILGIYERLIQSINAVLKSPFKTKSEWVFLIQIACGAILGIGGFAKVLNYTLTVYPQPTYWFFIGLIIGSIPVIKALHPSMKITPINVSLFSTIIVAMFLLTISPELAPNNNVVYLFISGIIAASTMIVPGLSGSLILLIMGSYQPILNAVSEGHLTLIAIVGCGAILGIVCTSKLIKWCLDKKPTETYVIIIGLLCGSIIKLYPGFPFNGHTLINILCVSLGLGLALKLSGSQSNTAPKG